MQYHNIY